VVLSGTGFGFRDGLLDSPHLWQLCIQRSKYSLSLVRTSSAAFWHNSLGSVQPASLHSLATKAQHSWTSFGSRATRFERMRRHNSLARTHVRMCLNFCSICSRIVWRVISMLFFSKSCDGSSLLSSFYTFMNLG
jgi:hypothetical protein